MTEPVLFAVDTAPLVDGDLYKTAYAMASVDRRAKTDRLRFYSDKRCSLGAELLLRHVLNETGETFPDSFTEGKYGKPFIPDSRVFYNLSHSGSWVICVAAECEVGCDIEQIGHGGIKVAKRFFTKSEFEKIAAIQAREMQDLLFCRYWTLKESFMKATGLGLALPMDSFEIRFKEEISVRQSVDPRTFYFREYSEIPDYCCAVCAVGQLPRQKIYMTEVTELLE